MTLETLAKLDEAFLLGCTDEEACLKADISVDALYDYQKIHPDYTKRKEQLKQNPILIARTSVVNGLKRDPKLSLDFLQRKMKGEFSIKTETDITSGNKPISIYAGLSIRGHDGDPQGIQPEAKD